MTLPGKRVARVVVTMEPQSPPCARKRVWPSRSMRACSTPAASCRPLSPALAPRPTLGPKPALAGAELKP
jgi:hypothetical protein